MTMQWKPLTPTPQDQQWLEWNASLARKIATIFGISPQELGVITVEAGAGTHVVIEEEEAGDGQEAPQAHIQAAG